MKPPTVVQKPPPEPEQKPIPLGDDSFFLKAQLSLHGGGVRELVLTKFEAANR